MTLNEKALEAGVDAHQSHGGSRIGLKRAIGTYFDSLAEQGIVLVDVREVVEFVRTTTTAGHWEEYGEPYWMAWGPDEWADAIEARFAPGTEASS